jgi:hypothetical protein
MLERIASIVVKANMGMPFAADNGDQSTRQVVGWVNDFYAAAMTPVRLICRNSVTKTGATWPTSAASPST